MRREADNSFFEIYDRHYASVRRFVGAVVKDDFTADDLTQETFVKAHKGIATFKADSSIAPWLMQIAYNLCRDRSFSRPAPSSGTSAMFSCASPKARDRLHSAAGPG
jgi:RNA polymerase sigma factor (sigma-70 family)